MARASKARERLKRGIPRRARHSPALAHRGVHAHESYSDHPVLSGSRGAYMRRDRARRG